MVRPTFLHIAAVLCVFATAVGAERDVQVKDIAKEDAPAKDTLGGTWTALNVEANKAFEAAKKKTDYGIRPSKLVAPGRHVSSADRGYHKDIVDELWKTLTETTTKLLEMADHALFGSAVTSESIQNVKVAAIKAAQTDKKKIRVAPVAKPAAPAEKLSHPSNNAAEEQVVMASGSETTGTKGTGHRMAFKSVVLIGAAVGALIGAVIAMIMLAMHQVPTASAPESVLQQHADDLAQANEANEQENPKGDRNALENDDEDAEEGSV